MKILKRSALMLLAVVMALVLFGFRGTVSALEAAAVSGDLAEIIHDAQPGSTVQLTENVAESITVSKDICLDLNGHSITGIVTVAKGNTLTVKDSTTDDFSVTDGYGKITVQGNVLAAEGYVAIEEADGTSFHRLDLKIHSANLRPSVAGIYYTGSFGGDQVVKSAINTYGTALSLERLPSGTNLLENNFKGSYTAFSADSWVCGQVGQANGTLLADILKQSNTPEENKANGETVIYSASYVKFKDGTMVIGPTVAISLRQVVETIDKKYASLSEAQSDSLLAMYEAYIPAMDNWDIPNLSACRHYGMKEVAYTAPTCTEDGVEKHWYCPDCTEYFENAEATQKITRADTVLPAAGHSLTKFDAKAATCTAAGNIEYWSCSVCGKYFKDQAATQTVTLSETVIAAKGHSLTKTAAKAATCTAAGNSEYWNCSACGKYFKDQAATQTVTLSETVIAAKGHSLTKTAAKAATCTAAGNIEYWHCSKCDKYFRDSVAIMEVNYKDTILSAVGHKLSKINALAPTLDSAGNREYWKCTACKVCFSDVNATKQVEESSMIEPAIPSYTITFVDEKNWPTGKKVKFAQNEDLLLKTYAPPEVEGYKWLGWFTKSVGGDLIDDIPAGNSSNRTIYARWEATTYRIIYNKAGVHNNETSYTIEKEVILNDPEWSGLKFKGWVDTSGRLVIYQNQAGVTVAKIPLGTTGNIEITATWTTYENLVNPSENGKLAGYFDSDTGKYYFLYDMGIIENIPLDQIFETHEKTTTGNYTMAISNTVTVESSKAQNISEKISNSVTQTQQWQDTIGQLYGGTIGETVNLSLGMDFGSKDVWQAKFGLDFGFSLSFTTESTTETTVSSITDQSTGREKEYASTIAYTNTLSTTSSTTMEIPGTMPNGTYAFVHAGDIRVFAAITYDPAEERYYIDTYSVLDNMHTIMLYYADKKTMYESSYGGLNVAIPVDRIKQTIDSCYYVKYNKGDGEGTMAMSVMAKDNYGKLSDNKFSKIGYEFDHWKLVKSDGTVEVFPDKAQVLNLANGGKIAELEAVWKENTYTVSYEGGGATEGSTKSSTHTYDVSKALTTNGFKRNYTVTYNYNGSGAENTTATAPYTFDGWKSTTGNKYSDKESVKNLTTVLNDVIKLTAQWKATSVTLPTPTRTGYRFVAWYNSATLGTKVGNPGDKYTPTNNITLYAKWEAIDYTVKFDAAGGSVSTAQKTVTYDSKYGTLPTPTKTNYTFAGWYLNGIEVTKDTYVRTAGLHTLTAQWVLSVSSYGYYTREIEVYSHTDIFYLGMSRQKLIELGYTKVKIELKIDGYERWLFLNPAPVFEIYDRFGNVLKRQAGGATWAGSWETKYFVYEVSIDAIRDDGSIHVQYLKANETWQLGNSVMTATAVK